jgi:hypothetical protein
MPGMGGGRAGPGGPAAQGGGAAQGGRSGGAGAAVVMRNLWFINGDGKPGVIRVQSGISNGTNTEIRSAENLEGMRIILREKING